MTKVVLLDIGGVLIDLDMSRAIKSFRERIGYERITEILDPWHQKGIYGEMEAGILSPEEFRSRVLEESFPGTRPEQVDECMGELLVKVPEKTAAAVKELAGRYPLYLLSNNNPISMIRCHALLEEAGLGKCFRGEFISCELKMLKPSAEFYREVIRRLGVKPEEIVFVDDSLTNVEGARAVGIDARWMEPGMELSQLLP
ncbi:MAG: HAD family phosphatase [Bacteroidales bacterium]|nr:HAD family phosphatase [Bacteroidales bacterium]